mmetsp:Transcript_43154/g.113595  ORF Transcript_43154/g.113595 Transcript_43154/m.113595 type:complete len:211 (-) Transcript_43154:64-696(-)
MGLHGAMPASAAQAVSFHTSHERCCQTRSFNEARSEVVWRDQRFTLVLHQCLKRKCSCLRVCNCGRLRCQAGVMSWVVFADELNPTPPRRSVVRSIRDVTNLSWAMSVHPARGFAAGGFSGSPIACGYVPADDSPGALWENLSQSQNRGAVQPVRLFADGLSKAKVSRKDVHGDCCSDRGSVCSGEGTRDAASPVTKPAQILKSLAYQEL